MAPHSESRYSSSSPSNSPPHSSADSGFFQQPPRLGNQFQADESLRRVLTLYVPAELRSPLFTDLTILADKALSPPVLRYLEDAERHPPELESHDAFAQPHDVLRTSEGWRKLQEMGAWEGLVAEGYTGQGRMSQFARYYIFSPSAALVTCPFAMTDGAAKLLSRHASAPPPPSSTSALNFEVPTYTLTDADREAEAARKVFKRAALHLISRKPEERWTSGQWMTERPGGSDVSRSETVAQYAPGAGSEQVGPWSISGHKFFSSASDADCSVLLARTVGSKKLSAFYAPMRLPDGTSNGVRIIRLKNKLGTRPLPTAELELRNMRGWMIGKEGDGIREIATVLNITRVHNSISAVSFMRRALEVAKAYSKVRVIASGTLLSRNPLHLHTLSRLEILTRATTHLAFLTVHLLSLSESPSHTPPSILFIPPSSPPQLLRILTPLTKAVTAKLSISVVSECLESLGGIGYLENPEPLNLARLSRDAQVLAIWEGTTNVLITDLVTSLKTRGGVEVLGEFVSENLTRGGYHPAGLENAKVAVWEEWTNLKSVLDAGSKEEITAGGRRVLWRLAWVVVGVLLLADARRDADAVAVEVTRRWIRDGWNGESNHKEPGEPAKDRGIVFGPQEAAGGRGRL